jgi:palmitoyl transferase
MKLIFSVPIKFLFRFLLTISFFATYTQCAISGPLDIKEIWNTGTSEVYVDLYTDHLPFAYTAQERRSYNDLPTGLGYGLGKTDENYNWDGLYVMGFRDSHANLEPIVGYGQIFNVFNTHNYHAGAGYSLLVTAREDIMHYTPFPGAAPILELGYKKMNLMAAYIPGGRGDGNIIFFWTKIGFQ